MDRFCALVGCIIATYCDREEDSLRERTYVFFVGEREEKAVDTNPFNENWTDFDCTDDPNG